MASEPLTPAGELVREAHELRAAAADAGEPARARWLAAQVDGLGAVAERLDGRAISYSDEVLRCYGALPEPVSEDELAEAHRNLERLLPGGGPLRERYQAWRQSHEMPAAAVLPALTAVNGEIRARTRAAYGLPEGESVELDTVTNQPWGGFNYYLGGLRSRVVMNTDLPTRAQFLVEAAAHESYPGHHTEHAWKEALLVRGGDQLEESIMMIGTQQCTISEGIATNALRALGDDAEQVCAALLAELGFAYDVQLSRVIRDATRALGGVFANAALLLYERGGDVDDVRSLLSRWLLEPEARVEKHIEFLTHPAWRSYVVVYDIAQRLVERWTGADPARFGRLLKEQLTPADLAARA